MMKHRKLRFGQNHRQFPVFHYNNIRLKETRKANKGFNNQREESIMLDQEFLENYKAEQVPIALTATEAMDILGVGRNTMYRLLNSGQLRGVRIGRTWRISRDAICSLLS